MPSPAIPPRPYQSLEPLKRWLTLAWSAVGLASLFSIVQVWRLGHLLKVLGSGKPLAEDVLAQLLVPWNYRHYGGGLEVLLPHLWEQLVLAEAATALLALPAGVLFYVFLFRARANLQALGSEARYAPHWIITGWVIPLLNLVRPCQVMADLQRASTVGGVMDPRAGALLRRWWGLVLVGSMLGFVSSWIIWRQAVDWGAVIALAALLRILLAVVTISMLRHLACIQEARARGEKPKSGKSASLRDHFAVDIALLSALVLLFWFGQVGFSRNVELAFSAAAAHRAAMEEGAMPERGNSGDGMRQRDEAAPAAIIPKPVMEVVQPSDIPDAYSGSIEPGVEGGVPGMTSPDLQAGNLESGGSSVFPAPLRGFGNLERLEGESPEYTAAARAAGISGLVELEALIDEQGRVVSVNVVKGLPLGLDAAAVRAVRTWKFRPAIVDGRPVMVYQNLTVNFQLN